jgi:phosphatidate cytidylyltransferase
VSDWFALFQLFGIVWLTDIGAYFAGKSFKGPKLLVEISPNKTWSGFMGGTTCGVLCGMIFSTPWEYALLISWLAQVGDFLESYAKRCAGKKDSNLPGWKIPGHGGILDRIDGLLLTTPVYYAIKCGV